MGVDRHEPLSQQVMEQTREFQFARELFLKNGWFSFFDKFTGYNDEIALHFTRDYNGKKAQIGDFSILVSERTIAQATGLRREGSRWFKKESLTRAQMNCLLKSEYHVVSLHKGFPQNFLREEWQGVLFILQKYIIREGRYTVTL
jgi:primosomal protein N''